MKNIFKSILAVVLSALAFTACADYNTVLLSDEMVALNSEKLSFDAIPTAPKTVTVNLDGDWIAVLPVECDWLKVEPSYGTGKTEVTITASENYDGTGALAGPRSSMVGLLPHQERKGLGRRHALRVLALALLGGRGEILGFGLAEIFVDLG